MSDERDRGLSTADMAGARPEAATTERPVDTSGEVAALAAEERGDRDAAVDDSTAADRNRTEARDGGGPASPGTTRLSDVEGGETPLFAKDESTRYRDRWQDVQAAFVDDPRQAVKQADELVAQLMQQLAKTFADERAGLEGQWDRGDDVSTEDLRVALQRYRSFFSRLLSL